MAQSDGILDLDMGSLSVEFWCVVLGENSLNLQQPINPSVAPHPHGISSSIQSHGLPSPLCIVSLSMDHIRDQDLEDNWGCISHPLTHHLPSPLTDIFSFAFPFLAHSLRFFPTPPITPHTLPRTSPATISTTFISHPFPIRPTSLVDVTDQQSINNPSSTTICNPSPTHPPTLLPFSDFHSPSTTGTQFLFAHLTQTHHWCN